MIADHERAAKLPPAQKPPSGNGQSMVVECAVYQAGSIYRAVCLDFGLIVERPSPDDAANELIALIKAYVQDARDAGLTPRDIFRPVPRGERQYVYRKVIAVLLKQLFFSIMQGSNRRRHSGYAGRVQYLSCSV